MSNPNIDKCIGCKKGIDLWTKKNNILYHLDLFATAEAGSSYECITPNILDYIEPNGNNGTYLPKEEYKNIFREQDYWWEDIIDLSYKIFIEAEMVSQFFNKEICGGKLYQMSNIYIENTLLKLAIDANIEISEENYPDLIKYKL